MSKATLSSTRFTDWDLDESIQAAIASKGWEFTTQIQNDAVPLARRGLDIVGQARTGSGKTVAFGIPIIESCEPTGVTQAIVLTPTRELAQQVAEEISWLQGDKGLRILTVYGGTDIDRQAKKLDAGIDIIVGTPGRVIDMSKREHINLADITTFCLDEADRMLDMGFFPDILWVLEKMENRSQTLLFSATFPEEVIEAANEFISEAEHVMSEDMDVDIPEIEQRYISVGRANKLWALGRIMVAMDEDDQMLIFANTKRMVDMLVQRLDKFRFDATGIHGDLPQNKRERIMTAFKAGSTKVVVATDVAARGLDVDGVTIVVNYDLPIDVEGYIHRIGRTGRMGREGQAWSFVSADDKQQLQKIVATWNLDITESDPPALPEGVTRDPVGRQRDWAEVSNNFGMVPVRFSVGKEEAASSRKLSDWIVKEAKLPEVAIGEIEVNDADSIVEVHVDRVETVLKVMSSREWNGQSVKAEIAN